MIETYDDKWNKFESSGKVADYLNFKGMTTKSFSGVSISRNDTRQENQGEFAQLKG